WQAATPDVFDFGEFSGGDFFGAVSDRVLAETVSRVLYPDDSTSRGRSLRFVQEYFLVACSLADIVARFLRRGNDWPALADKVARMRLIQEGPVRQVRMANLAIVGTHSTNGVAAIHSVLLRTTTVADFAAMFPERFSNKTNGVTPRRWLLLANPGLAALLTEAVGEGWVTDLGRLRQVVSLADDPAFRARFLAAKRAAKAR